MASRGGTTLRNCAQVFKKARNQRKIVCTQRCEASSTSAFDKLYPAHDVFAERHIGPGTAERRAMLDHLNLQVGPIKHNWAYHCCVATG